MPARFAELPGTGEPATHELAHATDDDVISLGGTGTSTSVWAILEAAGEERLAAGKNRLPEPPQPCSIYRDVFQQDLGPRMTRGSTTGDEQPEELTEEEAEDRPLEEERTLESWLRLQLDRRSDRSLVLQGAPSVGLDATVVLLQESKLMPHSLLGSADIVCWL